MRCWNKCRYGYSNFKKQKTIIPSHNMILNTTVQIFQLLLTRKYVCRLVPINCDFSGPAERVRLMTCRLIGNYHDREFTLYCTGDLWSTLPLASDGRQALLHVPRPAILSFAAWTWIPPSLPPPSPARQTPVVIKFGVKIVQLVPVYLMLIEGGINLKV